MSVALALFFNNHLKMFAFLGEKSFDSPLSHYLFSWFIASMFLLPSVRPRRGN